MRQRPQDKADSEFRKGIVAGLSLHLVASPVLFLFLALLGGEVAFFIMIFGFGVVQFLYFIPALVIVKRRGATRDFMKGLAMTAFIPFVLNAGCFGILALGANSG